MERQQTFDTILSTTMFEVNSRRSGEALRLLLLKMWPEQEELIEKAIQLVSCYLAQVNAA